MPFLNLQLQRRPNAAIIRDTDDAQVPTTVTDAGPQNHEHENATGEGDVDDPELKLPKRSSLVVMITANVLLQISFFIIVSSSNEYALHLGGTSTFSGIVIGIPTVFSGLALLPLARYDRGTLTLHPSGGYKIPLHISCGASLLGHILYALAYRLSFLYLILIGRIVSGLGFTLWMYCKRYCSDPRLVGVRRRTTLASWLVIGQGVGMSLGPFAGGLFYKVGFGGQVWNGYTAPAWVMAGVWAVFWVVAGRWYEDAPPEEEEDPTATTSAAVEGGVALQDMSTSTSTAPPNTPSPSLYALTPAQLSVLLCMCWFALTSFFILGAWEANLPVFGASPLPPFHWTPFAAGNFIALGGLTTFPFLVLNLLLARRGRTQDRVILAFGIILGLAALVVFLGLLSSAGAGAGGRTALSYGAVFACWSAVALGFNLATTVTLSTVSKRLPARWNGRASLAVQYANYTGRVAGAVWGGSGVKVGMRGYVGLQIALAGVGAGMAGGLWRELKTKMG
ncbi:hypothetical protein D9615_006548 [Tricholomella constricta]|uniref:MFS general substrate transporter n=1 Tax=Tricholomella constricta TaxID=117010 RepID=A0A8H5HA59_9AGAR|nr:hypothetical protein D9615_006548 [Tricholomella constricta]